MRIPFQLSVLASAVVLAGCGGSGGGPGGSNVRSGGSSYYTAPVHIDTFDPTVNNDTSPLIYDTFTANITGSGADVVFVGRETHTQDPTTLSDVTIQLYSWQNGTLVNKTSEWFDSNDNVIKGSEPSVHFTDFFKTGRSDMFVSHGVDGTYYGPAHVFRNTGTKFEKIEIPLNNVWSHGSDVGDLNGDTYPDIAITDYGPNTTLAINNTVDNFDVYTDVLGQNGELRFGGSDVVIGDFNNDGTAELILTDNGCGIGVAGCQPGYSTRMYGYTIDGNNDLYFHYIKDLPLPRLDLPGYDTSIQDHQVRIEDHDFNEDGVVDVIVFGRDMNWFNKISTIQFLQNDGSGNFTDVTDSVLVGYDENTHSTYRPTFLDINGDGKTDILVSGGDFSGNNNSHQILLKSSDNKYIAAYQNIITDFLTDAKQNVTNGGDDGNTVNIFRAPNGKTYLVTYYQRRSDDNMNRLIEVYMSELTDTTTVTSAQSAVDLLQSTWSYLSDDQAAEALNSTAIPYAGGYILDIDRAMQPVGNLTVNQVVLSGSLTAPGLSTNIFNGVMATDSIGRGYSIDLGVRGNNGTNLTSFNNYYSQGGNVASNLVATSELSSFVVGTNDLYTASYTDTVDQGWGYTISQTHMNGYSPWLSMSGVFGEVISSDTTEISLHRKFNNGTWTQFGWQQSQTEIKPGLVVHADPIHALYAVMGHHFDGALNGLEVMTGIEPRIVAGRLGVKIPERVDNSGNLMYNYDTVDLKNDLKRFARINYTYEMKYDAKVKVGGAFEEGGPTNANITLEMPL